MPEASAEDKGRYEFLAKFYPGLVLKTDELAKKAGELALLLRAHEKGHLDLVIKTLGERYSQPADVAPPTRWGKRKARVR